MAYDEHLAGRVRVVLQDVPAVTERRMFGGQAFLVGGHLAAAASSRGLMLRCDRRQTAELTRTAGVARMEMSGRELDGWLRVEPEVVASDEELRRWVQVGAHYAGSLPPK